MGRVVKDWKPDKVADAVVAPHRYRWDILNDEYLEAKSYKEYAAGRPYNPGDAIYVAVSGKAIKARVYSIRRELDRFGFWREVFTVQYETKAGLWSKLWKRTWPGFIQRGYKLAGLAQDMPD